MMTMIVCYHGRDPLRLKAFNKFTACVKKQNCSYAVEKILVTTTPYGDLDTSAFTKVINLPLGESFNKSWWLNVAIKQASNDLIFVSDADVRFGSNYFNLICENAKHGYRFFLTWNHLICLPGRDNPDVRIVHPNGMQAAAIGFAFNRNFMYTELGMMNENYIGYGGEDNDLYYRAMLLYNDKIEHMGFTVEHSYHHWVKNVREDNLKMLGITKDYPKEVISKLRSTELGQLTGPTMISIENLLVRQKKDNDI